MYSFIALMGNSISSDAAGTTAAGAAGSSAYSSIIMMVVMIAIFYFLLIRPQKKRDKEAKDMLAALKKGDKVVTIGGIHGYVTSVKENTVTVKVDDDTKIEFNKSAISSVTSSTTEQKEEAKAAPAKEEDKKASKKQKKEEIVEAPKAEEPKTDAPAAETKSN